jgi:hypothetical protein
VARAEDEGVTVHNGPSHQQQGAAIMIGRRFGRWHVLRRAGSGRGREARWECVCDCGTERAGARQVMLGELIDSVSGIARGGARRQGEGHFWPRLRRFPFYIMCGMERLSNEALPFQAMVLLHPKEVPLCLTGTVSKIC